MEAFLLAIMLVFLKIGYKCERWRGVETGLVVHVGAFDVLLFRWPCSLLCSPVVLPWLHNPLHSPLVQLYHRKHTSLARVNISLRLFLEVQEDKIP